MAEPDVAKVIPIGDGEGAKARRKVPSTKKPRAAKAPGVGTSTSTRRRVADPAEPAVHAGTTDEVLGDRAHLADLVDLMDLADLGDLGRPGSAGGDWDAKVAEALAFLRRRITGDYVVDEFGYDAELSDKVLMAALRPLYRRWFRVETQGLTNMPDTGGALLVANHSGTIAIDSLMTQLALLDDHPAQRPLRLLGANLVFSTPVVGELARKSGATLACNEDAERLLSAGQAVGVFPEGFKGVGKPYSERYKLQRFGRGGFVSAALRTRVPIIPVSIVGAEEIYPIIYNVKTLARLLGLPYFPITPTFPLLGPLGVIPLPSKWIIEFGEPIRTDVYAEGAADDPMLVFNLTDQVRETIQHTLYKLLMQRRSVFF